ncbi:trypsin [Haloactinospora alba]|uniref:Trypsin n=1 Tax=Haloactinospora alba TaxID=405555 RepID=A0A543NJN0_9ACTN|nr:trypsin-like serine protease [Haloactinospora alba]TQN32071.1 trypsin [Haloactinospora alba]
MRNLRYSGRIAGFAASLLAASVLSTGSAAAVTGPAADADALNFTAHIDVGEGKQACSGALVDPEWLVTAASCFADNPAESLEVPAGAPAEHTTATIGRTDLTTDAGQVRQVVELVPREDNSDVVLARLARRMTGITPVPLADAAPGAGQELTAAGYGRTSDEWAPVKLHTGVFTTNGVSDGEVDLTGGDNAAICPGDAGAPLVRDTADGWRLAGVASRSGQAGCFGVDSTDRTAVATRADSLAGWVDSTVRASRVVDFDCDSRADTVIGDPDAEIGGDASAGAAHVTYGGGGTAMVHQDLASVPGGSETNDRFGDELDTLDYNNDGCTDLVVGIGDEDIGNTSNAGMVSVVFGSRDGLGRGRDSLNFEQGKGNGALARTSSEAGDRFGAALAAGNTPAGDPYIVVGKPGEDIGSTKDAGASVYIRGGTSHEIHQDTSGVPGGVEADDRFGAAVASDGVHFAVGIPGEGLNGNDEAGGVPLFSHSTDSDGRPTPLAWLGQDREMIPGSPEEGDHYGAALSMARYKPEASAAATTSVLTVGVPHEDLGSTTDAGGANTVTISASGEVSLRSVINQDVDGVAGGAEQGDEFGAEVAVANRTPNTVPGGDDLLVLAGSPGEDLDGAADAGAVQVFDHATAPGDGDRFVRAGKYGIPGEPGADQRLGQTISATPAELYLGMPDGPAARGSVYRLPWSQLTSGEGAAADVLKPGSDGISATGAHRFGAAIR